MLAPDAWRRLETLDLEGGFVILNVADGPGESVDPSYLPFVEALLTRGSSVCGYVDTDYGRRSCDVVLAEAARYRDWYGVTAVFLDQVSSDVEAAPHYEDVVRRLRGAGAEQVVLNPGTVPSREIAELGDIVVTFEGTWADHRRHHPPGWVKESPASSVCHLVYSIPRRASLPRVLARAGGAGAGIVGISSHGMPNPWSMMGKWGA